MFVPDPRRSPASSQVVSQPAEESTSLADEMKRDQESAEDTRQGVKRMCILTRRGADGHPETLGRGSIIQNCNELAFLFLRKSGRHFNFFRFTHIHVVAPFVCS